ncbi:MAG: cyanophycinase [Gemmatimonadota bacterium]|jgi:cyanophycinase|nr:cyanophycinase [Gemmatimonadota bacterium]
MPARPRTEGAVRGHIIPIGGKLSSPAILDRFLALSGGGASRIAIIPTASSEPDMGTYWEREFTRRGAGHAKALGFERRSDCDDRDWLEWLAAADGIFLTGGNQLKLTTTLGGTSVAKLIRSRNAHGVHVAGTSAGAAFLSEHMIAYGDEGSTPRAGMVTMCAGLGLTNRFIFDQHFRQRDRLGRLLTALAYNPFAIGLGVDEDTAAFIGPDETVEVVGSGAVTVVDCADVEFSSIAEATPGDAVTFVGVRTHVLGRGARFNLHTRRVDPAVEALFHD